MSERKEYGVCFDCAKEGCPHPHSDDGEVFPLPDDHVAPVVKRGTINHHAVTLMERTVITSEWTPSDYVPYYERTVTLGDD